MIVEVRDRVDVPAARLKSALAFIDAEPVLDATLLDLLCWSAEYYRHPLGEVIAAALPVALRSGNEAVATAERWTLSAAARTGAAEPIGTRAKQAARTGRVPGRARSGRGRGTRRAVESMAGPHA